MRDTRPLTPQQLADEAAQIDEQMVGLTALAERDPSYDPSEALAAMAAAIRAKASRIDVMLRVSP